ncbi:hypothetical protein BCON_0361g00030 [Botryotinia convoluta]|uniref:Uncharacterized protein n=1 Tax=Botryotinia convoluta TaxID=54673 RepID=A0A4Z1HLH8_9HELO|nr:hypothetical protein BCON_0361g00030 [Botryotinia convoluta]
MIDSAQEEHFSIAPGVKPIVIGIYGIPGSGKNYLLSHLRRYPKLPENKDWASKIRTACQRS